MSLVIIYNGQRKIIKISSPNTLMQAVLVEAAQHYQLDPRSCILKHKKNTIDSSQPFRFANLSNNAMLDLIVSETSNKSVMTRIALTPDGGASISGAYDSSLSLLGWLELLISENKLPANCLSMNPEIIYLRSSYTTDEILRTVTFASIGLSGQSVRLQLRYLNKSLPSAADHVVTSLATTSSSSNDLINSPPINNLNSNITPSIVVASPDEEVESMMVVDEFVSVNNSPAAIILSDVSKQFHANAQPATAVDSSSSLGASSSSKKRMSSSSEEVVTDMQTSSEPVLLSTPAEIIAQILVSNFDSVSTAALVIITKYVVNILNNPKDCVKYTTINCANKLFVEKVAVCKGALDLLYSMGFRTCDISNSNSIGSSSSSAGGNTDFIRINTVNLPFLTSVYEDLHSAMQELNVPQEKLPVKKSHEELTAEAVAAVPVVEFDPFKSTITRTAVQPVRTESNTEKQLAILQNRRIELEGNPVDVQRNTEVLFPSADGTMSNIQDYVGSSDMLSGAVEDSSSGGMPKSLISKILRKPGEDESAPLTTKAVRDLQKAQKERVYSSTIVRVRFPDRVCLQGRFHPRHTMTDVYNWVHDCIVAKQLTADGLNESSSVTHDLSLFELYISPPRIVLPAISKDQSAVTLMDLKLVPAAVIHLSWNDSHPTCGLLKSVGLLDSSNANSSLPSNNAIGRYFVDSLLTQSDDKCDSKSKQDGSSDVASYPTGTSLVSQQSADISNTSSRGAHSATAGGDGPSRGSDGKDSSVKKAKPKWFKI